MQVQGMKNLPKVGQFTEEAYQNLYKKVEEYRKGTRGSFQYFDVLVKNSQSYCITFQKCLLDFSGAGDDALKNMGYYSTLIDTFQKMLGHQKELQKTLVTNFKQLNQKNTEQYLKQNAFLIDFQSKLKTYQLRQTNLVDSNKKFWKLYKSMISNIELYKQCFTDVKLIYNRDQKLRRYGLCESNYQELMKEYSLIVQLSAGLSETKNQIKRLYQQLVGEIRKNIRSVGEKIKVFETLFVQNYCEGESRYMTTCSGSVDKIATLKLEFCLVSSYLETQEMKYLNEDIKIERHPFVPCVLSYYKDIKDTHYPHIGIFLIHLEKELVEINRKRKGMSRQFFEMMVGFQKDYERYYNCFKEFSFGYEKRKKKSQEFFGYQNNIFQKSFTSTFEICLTSSQKVWKFINSKMRTIDLLIVEETRITDNLFRQLKIQLQKFMNRKEAGGKRPSNEKNKNKIQQMFRKDSQIKKNQSLIKLQILRGLFQLNYDKIKKNCQEIKVNYDSIIEILQKTSIENYANMKEQMEYDLQRLQNNNRNQTSKALDLNIQGRTKFLDENSFSCLLTDEEKNIMFQPDLNKIEEFKKLKKPVELLEDRVQEKVDEQELVKKEIIREDSSGDQNESNYLETQPNDERLESLNKNQAFIKSKVTFQPDQVFIKSYSCGFSDKIILTGRMYVTNQRICFFSKFNPKNVFFGQTFIQIPRKDIKKIQKRYNAVFFDNSISITTVNGQIFFTSFFGRNEAYDKICSAMEYVYEEMYVEEKMQQKVVEQELIIKQEDDLKQSQIQQRTLKIDAMMKDFNYKDVSTYQFTFKGLNALKFFKILETAVQISYNRSKYRGFTGYFKSFLSQTEVQLQEWSPDINPYFNSGNIKRQTPLLFTKYNNAIIPVPNSGIPFMPKQSKVFETHQLHFYSKDKYTIITKVNNKWVPYCDDFQIYFKKQVNTIGEDKVSMKSGIHVHFINSIMIKGILQSKSVEESKNTMSKNAGQINKYFKYLNKLQSNQTSRKQQGQGQTSEHHNSQEETEELLGQIDDLKKQKQAISMNLKDEKAMSSKLKIGFISSVILNVLLLFLLF